MLKEKQQVESSDDDPLIQILNKLGEGSRLVWLVFFFTIVTNVFSGIHSNSYIFIAEIPSHWCAVPELRSANWTDEQIRNVSSYDSCSRYDYNYTELASIGYDEASKWAQQHREAERLDCTEYDYANDVDRKSTVREWDLVCKDEPKRATIHMALSLGKFIGAGFLGIAADKYGRRNVYVLGILLLVTVGPLSAIVPWYWGFIILRLIMGMSFSATNITAFAMLTEVSGTHRQWMVVAYNCGFASGPIFVAGVAWLANDWRQVQLATSLPALLLLLFSWFMPESPRWLISQGRRKEAHKVLERFYGPIANNSSNSFTLESLNLERSCSIKDEKRSSLWSDQMRGLQSIFSSSELSLRLLIACFTWMTASLTYYVLALNVDNISADYYVFAVLQGATEIPSYLVPSLVLMRIGRRSACTIFYFISGILLFVIFGIGCTSLMQTLGYIDALIMAATLVSRFALSSAYGITIFYTSEFFPTVSRNSALGVNSAMAQVGSIIAPYSVMGLGKLAWWGPSTFCGLLVLVAGVACLSLPETRGRPLADTVEEELLPERGVVEWPCKQCCCKKT